MSKFMDVLQNVFAFARKRTKKLPGFLQVPIRSAWRKILNSGDSTGGPAYWLRVAAERAVYEDQTVVHDLPSMFHYWSNKYLRPKFEAFGFANPDEFFLKFSAMSLRDRQKPTGWILSIGAGNCDAEVRLAKDLIELGLDDFVIECIDINPQMLARGRHLADTQGVARYLAFLEMDFNKLQLTRSYDVVVANQSLHHVVALESLYAQVAANLATHGRFLVSDMIGRNGHMRWPEALTIVDQLWSQMPESKKYNHQLHRHESKYENWDCSGTGFEGVRAQDVLPCLLDRFKIELFVGYANVVDIFIDRGFGPNFDPDCVTDREFIDRVHAIDEAEMLVGRVKPTHAILVARSPDFHGETQTCNGLTARGAVRDSSKM